MIFLPQPCLSLHQCMFLWQQISSSFLFYFVSFPVLLQGLPARVEPYTKPLKVLSTTVGAKAKHSCACVRSCFRVRMQGHTSRPLRRMCSASEILPVSRETEGKHSLPLGCSCERCGGLHNQRLSILVTNTVCIKCRCVPSLGTAGDPSATRRPIL